MYYVYVIQSTGKSFLYIGSTPDLRRRLEAHNSKKNFATKPYAPFELVYYEAYRDERDALDRERKLKHYGSAIGHLKRRIRRSLKSREN